MHYRITSALLFSLLFLYSCQKDGETNMPGGTQSGTGSGEIMDTMPTNSMMDTMVISGNEQYLNLDSDYIYDQNTLRTYELLISPENLRILDNDPAAEEYVEGILILEGDTLSPVGIRYKGSIGAYVGCLSGNDWSNPSGSKTCTKLSMKVKINWEGREEKFYGLKKLQFHSMNNDASQLRERLGYHLFRAMGAPAPRCVHARLMINGTYAGLFALVEQVDGRFTRYNYDDGKGNLYKEVWPLLSNGNPNNEAAYFGALKTNEDENPALDIISGLGTALSEANDNEIKDILETYLDIDETLAYFVVDRMIRHDDGPMHWYCNSNDCTNHNYYWYEEPQNKKIHLIAWDMDNAFDNIIRDANPVTPVADKWGETRNNCEPFRYGLFNLTQWSASCDALIGGIANNYSSEYEALRETMKEGPLSTAEISASLSAWQTQIQDATDEAHRKHNDAISTSQWQNAIDNLVNQINYARTH